MTTLVDLFDKKKAKVPIVAITAYDCSMARLVEQAGVDIVLVGDSLGMVMQGRPNTLGVQIEDMIYHTKMVSRGIKDSFLIADMPFSSYEVDPHHALGNAQRLIAQAGAQMIKLEGASGYQRETIHFISTRNVPVCAHIGLSPQAINKIGSFKAKKPNEETTKKLLDEAIELERSGASMLVLEAVSSELAGCISDKLTIPTIGIGAGMKTDGQVLVVHDVLGMLDRSPWFSKNFLKQGGSIQEALESYVEQVRTRRFPEYQHSLEARTGGGT